MKKLSVIEANKLPQDVKDIVCDNCNKVDNCKYAYDKAFRSHECFETFELIKDEIYPEDEYD